MDRYANITHIISLRNPLPYFNCYNIFGLMLVDVAEKALPVDQVVTYVYGMCCSFELLIFAFRIQKLVQLNYNIDV